VAAPVIDKDLDFTVESGEAGKLLDNVLRARVGGSWNAVRALIERGKVTLDGERCTSPTKRLRAGSVITVRPAARRIDEGSLTDEQIAYVDPHIVVVRKPAGISTIPYEPGERGTLEDKTKQWLVKRGKHAPNASLGVVHRIDKETSGLVVFARTLAAKKVLSQMFREHVIERRYVAIAHGLVIGKHTLRSYLVEDRGDGLRGSAKQKGLGLLSVTHVAAMESLGTATLIACALETGRTHQIRIHLSEAKHPLVGDRVYTRDFIRDGGKLIEAPRMMLHAIVLGLEHPITGSPIRFTDPPPADLLKVASRLAGRTVVVSGDDLPL
jgi:23S rRNA pseudouridine1911/1915/1917 synthase